MITGYTIGIVTYHARFEQYFVPLINRLKRVFPDIEILCIANGHPNKDVQLNYLRKFTEFCKNNPNVRYLTHDEHQSLAKCWNHLIILSNTEKILILNDDTQVTELFREEFENKILSNEFSTINSSWSHFIISKSVVRKVGWFDERFLGIGQEDIDYHLMMSLKNQKPMNINCLGLKNYVADQSEPGWKNISKKSSNTKYSSINVEIFNNKWNTNENNPLKKFFSFKSNWHNIDYGFEPKIEDIFVKYYDFNILNTKEVWSEIKNKKMTTLLIHTQKAFFYSKEIIKNIYRKLFINPRSR